MFLKLPIDHRVPSDIGIRARFKVVVIKFLTDVSSSTTNISDLFIYFDLPAGNVNVNTVPCGRLSETVSSPPWALIMDLHKDNPSPKLRRLSAI